MGYVYEIIDAAGYKPAARPVFGEEACLLQKKHATFRKEGNKFFPSDNESSLTAAVKAAAAALLSEGNVTKKEGKTLLLGDWLSRKVKSMESDGLPAPSALGALAKRASLTAKQETAVKAALRSGEYAALNSLVLRRLPPQKKK